MATGELARPLSRREQHKDNGVGEGHHPHQELQDLRGRTRRTWTSVTTRYLRLDTRLYVKQSSDVWLDTRHCPTISASSSVFEKPGSSFWSATGSNPRTTIASTSTTTGTTKQCQSERNVMAAWEEEEEDRNRRAR